MSNLMPSRPDCCRQTGSYSRWSRHHLPHRHAKSTVIHGVDIVARSLIPLYEDLLERKSIFFSRHIYGDETTWRIAGVLHWLWVLVPIGDETQTEPDRRRSMKCGGYPADMHLRLARCMDRRAHPQNATSIPGIRRTLCPGEFKHSHRTSRQIIIDRGSRKGATTPTNPGEKSDSCCPKMRVIMQHPGRTARGLPSG